MPELRVIEGGASNSRPNVTSGATGVDTVRLRWRDASAADRAAGFGHERGVYRGARGYQRTDGGVTVGAAGSMMYVEARLAALLNGADDHGLYGSAELQEGARRAAALAGVDADAECSVGRLDLAGDLEFDDPEHGRRFLGALSALDVPWLKTGTEGGKSAGVETVYWRTTNGRSVVLRVYDKARESGVGVPGSRVRVERQRRYRKVREQTVATIAAGDMGALYVGRELRTLLAAAPAEHSVGDVPQAIAELRARVAGGELHGRTVERLVGYLALRGEGLPLRTRQRRDAELAALGISVRFGAEADCIAVAPVLAQLLDQWAA